MDNNNNRKFGNQDETEKNRELTKAEQVRLRWFEALTAEMESEGYRKTELTVSIVKANIFGAILIIPLFIIGLGLYLLKNRFNFYEIPSPLGILIFFAAFIVLIVVHELIHGVTWGIFAKDHFHDIQFGFMKKYMTPYCACLSPLSKWKYITGALMPLIILGILPMAYGILAGWYPALLMGIIMADSAAGDILIVWNVIRYRTASDEVVYIDHPTQAGGVIFEK